MSTSTTAAPRVYTPPGGILRYRVVNGKLQMNAVGNGDGHHEAGWISAPDVKESINKSGISLPVLQAIMDLFNRPTETVDDDNGGF